MHEVSTASCDLVNMCCGSEWSFVVSRDQRQECSEFAFVQLAQNFLREARRQRSDGQESVSASCCKLESFHVLIRVGVMVLILTCNLCAKVFDQQSHNGNPLFCACSFLGVLVCRIQK